MPVDTTGLVKVTRTVEQRQSTPATFAKLVALHLIKPCWQIERVKRRARLVKELEAVAADLEVAQLFGDDDLEDHRLPDAMNRGTPRA